MPNVQTSRMPGLLRNCRKVSVGWNACKICRCWIRQCQNGSICRQLLSRGRLIKPGFSRQSLPPALSDPILLLFEGSKGNGTVSSGPAWWWWRWWTPSSPSSSKLLRWWTSIATSATIVIVSRRWRSSIVVSLTEGRRTSRRRTAISWWEWTGWRPPHIIAIGRCRTTSMGTSKGIMFWRWTVRARASASPSHPSGSIVDTAASSTHFAGIVTLVNLKLQHLL
mmetsp:Transcript_16340/g.46696  ORF Transcript_16340/g.46696 Transcript_16340/m.46696 type:complete len:223 (+) Transcript_16340:564-1232(+)